MAVRTAWRLCRGQGIASVIRKRKTTPPGPPVHDDLLQRDFTAEALDVVWLTDITEHPTGEGKLYLCAIKDACSRRIVGYAIDSRMTASLAVRALENAVAHRSRAGADTGGCVVHSDRGSQFRSQTFQRALKDHGLVGSMGRVTSMRFIHRSDEAEESPRRSSEQRGPSTDHGIQDQSSPGFPALTHSCSHSALIRPRFGTS